MRVPFVALAFCGALFVSGSTAMAATDVALTADVDCTGSESPCLNLPSGARLALNGYTITGGNPGVRCNGPCRITGPGTIRDAGIGISAYGKLDLRQVDVVSNEYIGVQCFLGCRVVGPANLSDNGDAGEGIGEGIRSTGVMKLENVTVANNTIYGVLVADYPSNRGQLQARGCTFTGNGIGVASDKGIKLTDSSVTGNIEVGVQVGETGCKSVTPPLLKNTPVTGNGTGLDCGTTVACADIESCRSPRLLLGSTCGTSHVLDSGLPGDDWGVCSAD